MSKYDGADWEPLAGYTLEDYGLEPEHVEPLPYGGEDTFCDVCGLSYDPDDPCKLH